MAFQDTAEEELDYENDQPVINDEELLDEDDDDYEDLYGDVSVGMYGAPAPAPAQVPPPYRNAAHNGDIGYGDMDSGNEEEDVGEEAKAEIVEARPGIAAARPQEESVDFRDEFLPQVKEESLYGDSEPGPSIVKVKEEFEAVKGQGPPVAKGGKSVGGPNGIGGGGGEGGAGRGFHPGGWPAGSGPAGVQAGNALPVVNNNSIGDVPAKHSGQGPDSGGLMLFVGELQWWTTDAELEAALSEYGRIKNLKFFEEKASGKSKGYCQVEFFDSQAARVCKEKMDGRVFNGRACVVAFASPQTIKQLGAAQVGKNQANAQNQGQAGAGKKAGDGRNAGAAGQGGEGRGFNKGGRGQPGMERGRGNNQAPGRGRGRGMVPFGSQGPMGGPPGGMMPPRGMMGPGGGFEPGFGPPGGGYGMGPGGGFGPRGPMFGPPFPPMGPGLPGVPAHVNPAFFGRGNGAGPGMGPGMEGPPGGWGEVGMPGWEEHQRHMREGGFAGPEDMGGGEFGYGGEMGRAGPARERERGAGEGEWGPERRRREERSGERGEEWERGERHRSGGGEREAYREQRGERGEREKDKDWERAERPASRAPRDKDDERARSREDDHGKRRRMTSDRDRKAER
ncbi:hypothetical protein M758_3G194700 [Ceratodon purpureus]|nr:hypothetical protein M758_3G194700 [Ceratodon purpureus]